MSLQILSSRLLALQESNAQLSDLISRLANLKFQPGSVPLDGDEENEDNALTELTAEIGQMVREQDEDLELLGEEIRDVEGGIRGGEMGEKKGEMEGQVKRAIGDLRRMEITFRRAQVVATKNLKQAQEDERELLRQSYLQPRSLNTSSSSPAPAGQLQQQQRRKPNPSSSSAELSKDEKSVHASTDVTLALRRTHDLLRSELTRSQFANETLQQSTAALAQLNETYSTMDTLLSSSRNLLGTLLRSQKSDTWYLETAFYVLAATIAWLVFRRLLYGPLWWLVWFPLRIVFRSWVGVLSAVGLMGRSNVGEEVGGRAGADMSGQLSGVVSASAASVVSSVPEIRVGEGGRESTSQGAEGDSISEKVGKIIDESKHPLGSEEEGNQEANPKKRMWEEDVKNSQDKDEL